ncbi:MAG: hypothetical protein K8R41_07535 [Bacteroidales bacterium]|nr:hypothetical protein [Bacteroidales bacterium]
MKKSIFKAIIALMLLLFTLTGYSQFYNGSQLEFGKNRVQYQEFLWTFYMFDDYDIYFYRDGKELAVFTAKYAQDYIPKMERQLESNFSKKIRFIVFNNLTDLKQSNIGLINDEQYNTGGVTHIVGDKVFLYFNGSHKNFEKQIKAGIANVLINDMMYGGSIGSQIKSSTLFVLPDWYLNGLISFLSEEWSTDIDNRVKDGIMSGTFKKFNHLTGINAVFAGHSLWKYINDKYGSSSIPNIVHMTQISRSIENGFLYVIGVSFSNLIKEWKQHYKDIYESDDKIGEMPTKTLLKKTKSDYVYSNLTVCSDKKYLAYTTNELGKYKIWLYNQKTGKSKKIYKSGFKLGEKTDYSYPLLAWHPTGKVLSFIVEQKGLVYLYLYTIETKKFVKQILINFETILDYSYSPDGKYFVMSAVRKGQSDIYTFNIAANSHFQITHDIYDDLYPAFYKNTSKILFSSNRINDTISFDEKIPIEIPANMDIFLYDYSSKSNILHKITDTPTTNEIQPQEYLDGYISYLSDENGIYNQYIALFDSTISFVDTITHYRYFTHSFPATDYSRNIIEQNINILGKINSQIIYDNQLYKMFEKELLPVNKLTHYKLINTNYRDKTILSGKGKSKEKPKPIIVEKRKKYRNRFSTVYENDIFTVPKKDEIDIENYTFDKQSYDELDNDKSNKISKEDDFKLPKRRNYKVEYMINDLVTQVDFTFLNSTYQPFTGGGSPIYMNPGFNGLIKIGITDLLEDYRITGGVRLNSNLVNNEYLLKYTNLKHRLDREMIFHRQSVEYYSNYSIVRFQSHELYYILKWPFNQAMCIKGTAMFRNDAIIFLATDLVNLQEPNKYLNWASLKGEFIFDATRSLGLNLPEGTRYKIFGEYYQLIDKESINMAVLGLDFRHYQKIHRNFIWANRFAASTSFGKNKLIYYMGGVDNWLLPKFNQETPIDYSQKYAYQTIATNMRGFDQNIRNGNSFFIFNTELRFPVFKYFFNRPIKSDFLRNFQVVGFADIGTAWTGWNPYSKENSLYISTIEEGPLTITVELQKEPIVAGFGGGLRTRIFGYFVRGDIAWGIEDGVLKPHIFYLSLSLDF